MEAKEAKSISSLRKIIEGEVKEFYSGFGGEVFYSDELGTPEEIETKILSIFNKNADSLVSRMKTSIKEIDTIRSKYVPWEVRNSVYKYTEQDPLFGTNRALTAGDKKFFYESYENAFMRALGMPSSDIFEKSDESFIHKLGIDEYTVSEDILDLKRVLEERENIDVRSKKISQEYWNIDAEGKKSSLKKNLKSDELEKFNKIENKYREKLSEITESSTEDGGPDTSIKDLRTQFVKEVKRSGIKETDNEIALYFDININQSQVASNLYDIYSDINIFSYLLFPPVQNSSISKCISDPSSLVSLPFEEEVSRIVNLSESKKSLLETILRIRLDKISGLNYDKVRGVAIKKHLYKSTRETREELEDEIKYEDFVAERSIIESIITNRLFKSIHSTSIKIAKDIEAYTIRAANTRQGMGGSNKPFGDGIPETPAEEESSKTYNIDYGSSFVARRSLDAYEHLKIINDSIYFIMSEKETAASVGTGSAQSSSLRNGALFDSILTAVSFPGQYIEEKITEEKNRIARESRNKEGVKKSIRNIDEAVGLYRGVGILDVLIFGLAMFLVDESILMGMLSPKGYENLKKSMDLSKGFFRSFERSEFVRESRRDKKALQARSLKVYTETVSSLYSYVANKEFLPDEEE